MCSPAVSSLVCRSCDYTLQASCSGVSLPGVKIVTMLDVKYYTLYSSRTPHCGNYGSLLGLNRLYSVSVSQPSYLTVSLSPAPIALPTPRDHRISALPPVLVVPNVDSYPIRDGCVPYTPIQHHKSWPVCVTATAGTDGWTGLVHNKHQYDLLYLDIKISNLGHLVTPFP